MKAWKDKLTALAPFKYPLLILLLGIGMMLVPSGKTMETVQQSPDMQLQSALCAVKGVGDTKVILSENGVVIVCQGAENAAVRLDIIRAANAYTGFGTDRITVLKMADSYQSAEGNGR